MLRYSWAVPKLLTYSSRRFDRANGREWFKSFKLFKSFKALKDRGVRTLRAVQRFIEFLDENHCR
jgi:hypothetical protein